MSGFFFPAANIWVGALGAGLFGVLYFDLARKLILSSVEALRNNSRWRRRTVLATVALGTAAALFSDPVWRLALGGDKAILIIDALLLFAVLATRSIRFAPLAYLAFALAGGITPFALLPMVILLITFWAIRWQLVRSDEFRVKRYSSWLALFAYLTGLSTALAVFKPSFSSVMESVLESADPLGYCVFIALCVVPVVIAFVAMRRLLLEGLFLDFSLGILAIAGGLVAYTTLSPFPQFYTWSYVVAPDVMSGRILLAVEAVLAALALTFAIIIFTSFAFHLMPRTSPRICIRVILSIVLVGILGGVVGRINRKDARELRQVLEDAAEELVRECEGIKVLYSDGVLDERVKRIAAQKGQELSIRPLISYTGQGAAQELGEMVEFEVESLKETAVQFGFELWQRRGLELPVAGGLVGRPGGWPAGEAERAAAAGAAIGARLKDLFDRGAVLGDGDRAISKQAGNVLWRLGRIARRRGDFDLAESFDEANLVVTKVFDERLRSEREGILNYTSNREKLWVALNRANFRMAEMPAKAIVALSPKYPAANFALGMLALMNDKLDIAEKHLSIALEGVPDEPAFLNNLAVVYFKLGKYARAKELSDKAIRLAPNMNAIKELNEKLNAKQGSAF